MVPTTVQLCAYHKICYACEADLVSVASIGTTIGSHFENEFSRVKLLQPIALVWMISEMVADAFITVSLVWYLVQHDLISSFNDRRPLTTSDLQRKNKTGMKQTDNFINKLIRRKYQPT